MAGPLQYLLDPGASPRSGQASARPLYGFQAPGRSEVETQPAAGCGAKLGVAALTCSVWTVWVECGRGGAVWGSQGSVWRERLRHGCTPVYHHPEKDGERLHPLRRFLPRRLRFLQVQSPFYSSHHQLTSSFSFDSSDTLGSEEHNHGPV